MKKRRLDSMQHRATHVKKQLAKKHFSKWKRSLKMQTGKKLGKYTINRGAEMAIYVVLAEQLKAHRRRWGDEGTGYIEGDEKRLHKREMRQLKISISLTMGFLLSKAQRLSDHGEDVVVNPAAKLNNVAAETCGHM